MKKINDKGIALVSVMIVATVCLLVATIVLEITYTSLLSRKVYKTSNDNMYTAESAVDDMESVLQSIAVYAVKRNNANPTESFINIAEDVLLEASGASDLSEHEKIADYIYSQLDSQYKEIFRDKDDAGNVVRDPEKFSVTAVKRSQTEANGSSGSLAITVSFEYENDKGFLTRISTDLVLNDVTKRKTASDYSIGSYSMFTGGGITVTGNDIVSNDKKQNVFKQEGNTYIGTMADEAPTAFIIDNSVVDLAGAAIVNGDIYIKNQGVLCFTSGKDDNGARTEVTVKGKIYIDSTSALVINEDIDFMCQDIILVDGSSERSAFDTSENSYINYNGTSTFNAMFPYNAETAADIQDGVNIKANVYDEFANKSIGGCILVAKNKKAYVAQFTNTGWKLLGDGAPATNSALINANPLCIAEAKTTIRTYDNKEVVVDPELAKFVNCQLLYMQGKTLPNSAMIFNSARYIMQGDSTRTIVKNDVDFGLGGSSAESFSSVNGMTTTEVSSKLSSGGDGFTLTNPISLNGNSYTSVKFKVGVSSDAAQNVTISDPSIVFACLWDAYTVQCNGGYYVGIFISADKCEYKPMGHKYSIGYSILGAMNDTSNSESSKLVQLMDDLQYVTFVRDSGLTKNNGYFNVNGVDLYDYGYRLCMIDNLFKGGMTAFSASSGSGTGGSVTMDSNSMYDFIGVENWTQR
ncbi:MAG: hypothetical protein ACI39R_02235 [Lachnospiraceae bacterium]